MGSSAPAYAANDGVIDAARGVLGAALVEASDCVGEVALHVEREALAGALRVLRDTPGLEYQQLMEIAGVDHPDRAERFEVVYCLLSLTRNHRIRVHVSTDEERPVPSVTAIWPNAGWLEREVYDMYGVLFEGNPDLRRILTDYGFRGHPQRKDFPLTGFTEMRYSEEAKRVVYEPVQLAQDFRSFDFLSPWEGAAYAIPGDEKARQPQAKGSPTPVSADELLKADLAKVTAQVDKPKVTERPGQSGAGEPADSAAERRSEDAVPHKAAEEAAKSEDAAPKPTDADAPPRPEKDDA